MEVAAPGLGCQERFRLLQLSCGRTPSPHGRSAGPVNKDVNVNNDKNDNDWFYIAVIHYSRMS